MWQRGEDTVSPPPWLLTRLPCGDCASPAGRSCAICGSSRLRESLPGFRTTAREAVGSSAPALLRHAAPSPEASCPRPLPASGARLSLTPWRSSPATGGPPAAEAKTAFRAAPDLAARQVAFQHGRSGAATSHGRGESAGADAPSAPARDRIQRLDDGQNPARLTRREPSLPIHRLDNSVYR